MTNALGYFVNLVGDVVGGSVPRTSTRARKAVPSIWSPTSSAKTPRNPWDKTFAEEQGFTRNDSVVTISTSYLANANIDHDSVARIC